jgi:two-component system LytT family sensor kinase
MLGRARCDSLVIVTRRGFWTAQGLWWGFYIVIFHVATLPGATDTSLAGQMTMLFSKMEKGLLGFSASLLLSALYAPLMRRFPLPVLGGIAVGTSLVLGFFCEVGIRALSGLKIVDTQLFRASLFPGFTLVAWSALYFSFVYRERADIAAERALRATALATEAQLAMLRYQVNPHFLFNSLNSLRSLISEDPNAARDMVTRLSELFRYSLRTTKDDLTVADEIGAIRNYLDIHRIRFEDHLAATVVVDDAAAATHLPSFLIHPLVENAVKYGFETSPRPLRIEVTAARAQSQLRVEVANTGTWLVDGAKNGRGTGTGMTNLRERLRHLYPGRHGLEITHDDGWVRVRLTIDLGPS